MESKIVKAEDAVKASTEYFNGNDLAARNDSYNWNVTLNSPFGCS